MKNLILKSVLIFIFQLLYVFQVNAGEHVLQPKIGFADWNDNSNHSVKGNTFNLDSRVSASAGFMYLYRLDNGFGFGAEHYAYSKDFTHTNGSTGEMDTVHFYALAEYYFNNDGIVKPFLGVGVGGARAELTGAINQEAAGFSAQIKGGVEFELSERFSIATEVKYFTIDIDEEITGEKSDIDSEGYGIFVGFSFKI